MPIYSIFTLLTVGLFLFWSPTLRGESVQSLPSNPDAQVLERLTTLRWSDEGLAASDLEFLTATVERSEFYPFPFRAAAVLADFSWDAQVRETVHRKAGDPRIPFDRSIYFYCLDAAGAGVAEQDFTDQIHILREGKPGPEQEAIESNLILAIGVMGQRAWLGKDALLGALRAAKFSEELSLAVNELGDHCGWLYPEVLAQLRLNTLNTQESGKHASRLASLLLSTRRLPAGTYEQFTRLLNSDHVSSSSKVDIAMGAAEKSDLAYKYKNALLSLALQKTSPEHESGALLRLFVIRWLFGTRGNAYWLEGFSFKGLDANVDNIFPWIETLVHGQVLEFEAGK